MKKIFFAIIAAVLVNISLVSAHEHSFSETMQLIDSGIGCDKLTDEQLEAIGDYYMEQMHPGKAHEMMDKMMGGEGSESLRQVHITMAKRIYCNEDVGGMTGSGGMMGMMGSGGMMGMMNMMRMMMGGNMMNNGGYGMMGNNPVGSGYSYWGFWNVIWLLFWIGIIVLIILLICKFILKRKAISVTPLEILKKRYAKGEITKKQFEKMKKELK